jgi:RNA polymerase sigma-70 factor (ECF subfamily)
MASARHFLEEPVRTVDMSNLEPSDSPTEETSRDARIASLLMRHRNALFGYIYSCVPHASDAEDLLQEVSLVAMRQAQQLRDANEFLPWGIEIARRQILAFRRQASRRSVLAPEVVSALADDAIRISRQEPASRRSEALLACLSELPAHGAQIILARYDDTFTSIEALAEQWKRTVSATYALVKRIRMTLRECVTRRLSEEC